MLYKTLNSLNSDRDVLLLGEIKGSKINLHYFLNYTKNEINNKSKAQVAAQLTQVFFFSAGLKQSLDEGLCWGQERQALK